jgi:hypothetical protein
MITKVLLPGLSAGTNAGYKVKHAFKYLVKSLVIHAKRSVAQKLKNSKTQEHKNAK